MRQNPKILPYVLVATFFIGCAEKKTVLAGGGVNSSTANQSMQGPMGPEGPVGPVGPEGPMGPAGPTGATGAVGPRGAAGTNGTNGTNGATGNAGPQGAAGPAGPQGLQGLQGPTGATGAPGAPGATGPQGPAGPAVTFPLVIGTCPATFTKTNSYLCMTGWAVSKLPFDDAQLTCHTMGAHICKYPEIQMGWTSQPPILGWIGNRVGDDLVMCINNNNNVDNPEGLCNKNVAQSYRCCISTTGVE